MSFLLAGPADVAGLQPGAIVRRYPAPGTLDHESDRCPYVELADPALPWRYTPAPTPTGADLHPWLVLVVGLEGSELTLTGGQVTIEVSAQQDTQALGDPASAYRFAHVQQDAAGHRVTRVLSGRPLQPGTDYLAVVVPAYDRSGARSWTGAAAVTVPVYDAWRFSTAVPAGSFEDLAALLHPGDAPATTGRAPLHYPRLAGGPELSVLGALVARPADAPVAEDPLPPACRPIWPRCGCPPATRRAARSSRFPATARRGPSPHSIRASWTATSTSTRGTGASPGSGWRSASARRRISSRTCWPTWARCARPASGCAISRSGWPRPGRCGSAGCPPTRQRGCGCSARR